MSNARDLSNFNYVESSTTPSSPVNGDFWYNPTDYSFKFYDGANWQLIKSAFEATGGTITTAGGYKYHTFTSSGTFTVSKGSATVEYLVVAGGGGGGGANSSGSGGRGGGGAGGMLAGSSVFSSGSYTVTIGAGGAGGAAGANHGSNGSNSSISGSVTITSLGGGYGAAYTGTQIGGTGGSGGGSAYNATGGSGTPGQGNNGGGNATGGCGGGGKGSAGSNTLNATNSGSDGGDGLSVSLWGKNLTDEIYLNDSVMAATNQRINYAHPRTWGADISYRF